MCIRDRNNGVVIPPSDFLSAFTGEALLYGTEYTEEQINNALASDSPRDIVPSTDTDGHGTFLAGIAAGGQLENGSFSGAAPGCRLGIVKLKPAKEDVYKRQLEERAGAHSSKAIAMVEPRLD